MKANTLVLMTAAAVSVLTGAGWMVLPALRDAQTVVDAQVSERVERARRLMHRYSAALDYKSLLLGQLRQAEIDVDIADPRALLQTAEPEVRSRHKTQWELHNTTDWGPEPEPARLDDRNLAGQIKNGLETRKSLVNENDRLLDGALQEVNAALAIRSNGATGQSHVEGLRLKSVVLLHKGLRERTRAELRRTEALPLIRRLREHAADAAAASATANLLADSKIDELIAAMRERITAAAGRLEQKRTERAGLEDTIRGLEARLADVRNQAAAAREALDRLIQRGIDFSDPDPAQLFARQLNEADRRYRAAVREVHVLQFGDLAGAKIDISDDFVHGRYIPAEPGKEPKTTHGLSHFENERSVLKGDIEREEAALDRLRADSARLEAMKNGYTADQERAIQRRSELRQAANETYEDWNRAESEAFAFEDKALGFLDQSAAAARQAASAADQRVNAARAQTQSLSVTARERSVFTKRAADRWVKGFLAAQEADARLVRAWIFASRYQAASHVAGVLTEVAASLELSELDPSAHREQAEEAQKAGVEAVTQTLEILKKVHGDVDRHWTVTALEGAAIEVLAQLGYPGFMTEALEAYRAAVKGREDQPFADGIVSRLNALEAQNR
jgi:hypothetical protein